MFGDLYMWGWNVNGQLGLPVYETAKITYADGRSEGIKQKLPTVFSLPELIHIPRESDGEYEILNVTAGVRHTVLTTLAQEILGSGWNNYSQLSSTDGAKEMHSFKLIQSKRNKPCDVICGDWCTIIKE